MKNVCLALALSLLAAGASAATFTVTNTNDSGPGSLRQAITDANAASGTVAFSIGSGVQTITPLTALPDVNSNVTIDGSTQPGYAGTPVIELNDSSIATGGNGSCLVSSGTLNALAVNRCSGRAISMNGGRVTASFIGTDVTGHTALPNSVGIAASGQAARIGGSTAAEGNLISGNTRDVIAAAAGTEIAHNRIGTDLTGETAFPFNGGAAISVENADDVSIHDNVIGAHNVGIDCFLAEGVLINNNHIGVSPSNAPLPNSIGIHIDRSDLAQIGTGGANVIAFNTVVGIEINGASVRNTIRGNSIHHNGTIGIDLSNSSSIDGVSFNDFEDFDSGPNLLQNFPFLNGATSVGGQTTITGTINTNPNQLITLDFYASGQCSNSGNGEGETPIGSATVQTNSSGNGTFTATFAATVAAGSVVTATATDPFGNTSEFSSCRTVQGTGTFVLGSSLNSVLEGSGDAAVFVLRTNGTAGTATVNFATSNGTAIAGSDYTATSGTLSFADGESVKFFTIPITNDNVFKGNRTFTLTLSGPSIGSSVGNPSTETITILDDEAPRISIADASVVEGNSGTTNMTFTVTLTGSTNLPATMQYATSSGSAFSFSDFQQVSGTLTFNPGETQKTITVPIFGDTVGESDETFTVFLSNPTNAILTRSAATGTIINDDVIPTVTASDVTIVEGNNGISNAVITLTASQPFFGEVDFFTVDGSAKNNSDYQARSGFFIFNNETTKTITIPIVGDAVVEPDEAFTVRLSLFNFSSPTFVLPRTNITVTILNDDTGVGPTRLSIPAGGTMPLTINLGSTTPQTITFTSSNPDVATIPATVQVNGVMQVDVTGVHAGNATITGILPPGFGTVAPVIDVFVYDPVTLVLNPSTVHVPVGGTATIRASFNPALNVTETALLTPTGLGEITVPDRVTIDAGQTAAFTIKGIKRGHIVLTATLGAGRANAVTFVDIDVDDAPTTPSITQVSPPNGPAAGGTGVTINGANLRADCTIRFGGVPDANVSFVSASSITATTPEHAPGAVDVSLACGTDAFNFTNGFTYLAASATLSNVTPNFGSTGGNTLVKITGANIASGCWPFFDGIPARSAIVNGAEEMIAATPAHAAAATVPVVIRCSGAADASLANAFTYSTAAESSPVITAVDPLVGSSGKSVTISGAGFRFDDVVTFDATRAALLATAPGTHIVRIPDVPLGKTSISVTDPSGHASTTGPIFTIVEPQPPQIASVTPATTRPSNEVTLDGSGFRPGYKFTIGDQPAPIVTLTYTRVVLRVPQLAPGSYAVNVLNDASKIAAVGPQLKVLAAGLAVTRVAPMCVTTDGGEKMTINGSGFVSGAVVTFDGAIAAASVVDAQTITLTLPPLPVGSPRVVVTNPNGDSASLTNAFNVTSPFDPNGCAPRSRPARH